MRVDTNSKGHSQWFYFQTRNTRANKTVKFNIVNFYKRDSLYSQGLQPNVWSFKKNRPHYVGWFRAGTNVKYSPSRISRPGPSGEKKRRYYCLSFDYTFEHTDDHVWFAFAIPYTYTMLTQYIKSVLIDQRVRAARLSRQERETGDTAATA